MIGLEYILNLFSVTQQELANELNIKKQNVSRWFKGERKIPEKYLDILSQKFNLPIHYFNMELKRSDELRIELLKFKNENKPEIINKTFTSEEWGEYHYTEELYEKHIKNKIILMETELQKQEILEEIHKIFSINFNEEKDDIKEYSDNFRKINGIYSCISTILESGKIKPEVIMEILIAVILAYEIEEGLDARPLVWRLQMVLKSFKFDEKLKYSVSIFE